MASSEIGIAQNLRKVIEAGGQQAEIDRRAPSKLIQKLNAHGLFATMIPAQYGGTERTPLENLELIEELAYADSAIGWHAMIYATTALMGSFLPADWAQKIYSVSRDGDKFSCPIMAGAGAPSGKAEVVDGGILVSGRWAWGSGTHHADWIADGTMVFEDGEIKRTESGAPVIYVAYFEKDKVHLHDNWDTSGLRGTGSVDFEVKDCFVSEGRWTNLGQSRRQIDAPLFRFPFYGFFATAVASVALGIARRALDDFQELSGSKVPMGASSSISTSPITQLEFGRAEALAEGARHFVRSTVSDSWERVLAGDRVTTEDKRQLRLAASQATTMCTEAVDRLYSAAGGTALQGHCPLQKHFRDIHAATQHRMVSPEILRMAAGVKLDGESTAQL